MAFPSSSVNSKDVASIVNSILKEQYPAGFPTTLYYKEFPFYGMLAKGADLKGRQNLIPMRVSFGQGRSSSFAEAVNGATEELYEAWNVKSKNDYSYSTISRKLMKEANDDTASFVKYLTEVVNGRIRAITNSHAVNLFGDGSGSRGAIATGGIAGAVLTLSSNTQGVNFEVGQRIEVREAGNLSNVRDWAGDVALATITKVDRAAGTLEFDVSAAGGTDTIAAGDQLFVVGDWSATPTLILGLQAWLPATVSGSDNFLGVNRSVDRTRLAGHYRDFSGGTIEEALVQGGREISRESGSSPDVVLMNDDDVAALLLEMGSKVERSEKPVGEFSWSSYKIHLPSGAADIVADRNCPKGEAFMLKLSTWKLCHSPGELIEIVDEDGHILQRHQGDGFEIRAASYAELVCFEPVCNGRFLLP